MKATDLRIGNFHNYDTGEGIEVAITDVEDLVYLDASPNDENYQPIPLTEEWLEKFGFTDYNLIVKEKKFRQFTSTIELSVDPDNKNENKTIELWSVTFKGDDIKDANVITKVEHVHQLQNLYFALMGEELEIKVPA